MSDLMTYAASAAITTAGLSWLAREIITHFLSKDIENYKLSLQNQYNCEIERLKADLRERELLSGKLIEKRAIILGELYGAIVDAVSNLEYFVNNADSFDNKSRRELFEKTEGFVGSLREKFQKNRIWISEHLSGKVESLTKDHIESVLYGYEAAIKLRDDDSARGKFDEELVNLWNKTQKEVPRVRSGLETEFRLLLGVETASAV